MNKIEKSKYGSQKMTNAFFAPDYIGKIDMK